MLETAVRKSIALLGGVFTTAVVFWIMQWMISRESPEFNADGRAPVMEFVRLTRDSEVRLKARDLPEDPPDQPPPPDIPELALDTPSPSPLAPDIPLPAPDLSLSFEAPVIGQAPQGLDDRGLIAISRIPPRYPSRAARKGIEGWVKVSLLITETGTVKDVVVLDAQPPNIFDLAATRAVYKWKFKPRIVDGKATQTRVEQTVEFTLDK